MIVRVVDVEMTVAIDNVIAVRMVVGSQAVAAVDCALRVVVGSQAFAAVDCALRVVVGTAADTGRVRSGIRGAGIRTVPGEDILAGRVDIQDTQVVCSVRRMDPPD